MKQNENNDKWLAEIKDKMLDFQAEVPANGWERVSSALPNSNGACRLGYWSFRRFGWWGVAAAVLLCLVMGGGYILQNKDSEQQTLAESKHIQDKKQKEDVQKHEDSINFNEQTSGYQLDNAKNKEPQTLVADNGIAEINKGIVASNNEIVAEKKASANSFKDSGFSQPVQNTEDTTKVETAPPSSEQLLAETQQTECDSKTLISEPSQMATSPTNSILTNKEDLEKGNSHWSFGMNIGGHGSLLASNLGSNMISNSGVMDDSFHGTGSNASMSDLDDYILESSNHTSWSIGLSVDKEILPHTYVETGVVYTQLSSDVRYEHRGEVEQKIHYLGVPLRVNYMLLSSKPYQLYVGGGVMLEHSLYATRDGKRFDAEPWQLSSNVSLGGQYKISKNLSLYLEPGLSWYFNANKDIPTLRTESPLYLNIKGGVRLSY